MFSPSGTQGLLNGFSATLLAFSNVVSDCMCSLPVCRSIRQSNRVDWLLSFSKMTSIFRQCPFGDSFPARAKIICSPTNQMPASTATSPLLHLNARQNYRYPAHNTRTILAPPTLSIYGGHCCVFSCLLLAHVLALVPVSRVTTPQLSSPGSSMSATNRGVCTRALSLKLAGFSISQV